MSDDDSHLFICFSSKDEATAREVVEFLEDRGMPCWMSSRDVQSGENYQETIVHALERAKGIVFLFSESSSQSGEIKKELSIGGSINAPVFPLRLSPITPSGALRYELATRQWIDIFPDQERALGKLLETIRKALTNPVAADGGAPTAATFSTRHWQAKPRPAADRAPSQPAPAPAKKSTKARTPLVAPDSQEFEALRALLARHIGPIAKVMVQKASTEARSLDEFFERLGAHVSAPADRAAFLQAARARLAVKS